MYHNEKLYQDSLAEFREAIRLDPKGARSMPGMALTYGEMGRDDDELRYAKKAVELDPKSYSLYTLGMAYVDLQQEAEALKQGRRAKYR